MWGLPELFLLVVLVDGIGAGSEQVVLFLLLGFVLAGIFEFFLLAPVNLCVFAYLLCFAVGFHLFLFPFSLDVFQPQLPTLLTHLVLFLFVLLVFFAVETVAFHAFLELLVVLLGGLDFLFADAGYILLQFLAFEDLHGQFGYLFCVRTHLPAYTFLNCLTARRFSSVESYSVNFLSIRLREASI